MLGCHLHTVYFIFKEIHEASVFFLVLPHIILFFSLKKSIYLFLLLVISGSKFSKNVVRKSAIVEHGILFPKASQIMISLYINGFKFFLLRGHGTPSVVEQSNLLIVHLFLHSHVLQSKAALLPRTIPFVLLETSSTIS